MKKVVILGLLAMAIIVLMGFALNDIGGDSKADKEQVAFYARVADSMQPLVISEKAKVYASIYVVPKSKEDSLMRIIDSLKTKLFLANYTIEKVDFYTKIVERKPSQMKFYKGWIRRTIKVYKKK